MHRLFKILGAVFLGLILVVLVTGFIFYRRVESIRHSNVNPGVSPVPVPTDEASIAEGRRLVQVKACGDCHGKDMGGFTFINEAPLAVVTGSNLTSGRGSKVAGFQDIDWVRAIRFGVSPEGRPLMAMPAGDFHGMSDLDLGRMIAYLKTLPPVDRENRPVAVGPLGYLLYNLGQLPLLFPFQEVDLNPGPVAAVPVGATPEYGKYLSQACTGCHGREFAGGKIPGTPPEWPAAKNLTPGGAFASWSLEDFKTVLRTGVTPGGHQIEARYMPWTGMQAMTETEIEALYKFLKTLPAK